MKFQFLVIFLALAFAQTATKTDDDTSVISKDEDWYTHDH